MDRFEILENDVYSDGCKNIQSIEENMNPSIRGVVATEDNIEKKDIAEASKDTPGNIEKNESSISSDVHIVILEETSLPDLEPLDVLLQSKKTKDSKEEISEPDGPIGCKMNTMLVENIEQGTSDVTVDNRNNRESTNDVKENIDTKIEKNLHKEFIKAAKDGNTHEIIEFIEYI